jgi:hypothetical protein
MTTIATPYPAVPSQPERAGASAGAAPPDAGADAFAQTVPPEQGAAPAPGAGSMPPMRKLGADAAARKPRRLRLTMIALAVAALAAAGAAAAWYLQRPAMPAMPAPAAGASSPAGAAERSKAVAATIDGKPVMEVELAGLINSGADRAVALDRYINKVLAAEAARGRYADDARTAVMAAEREILANLYLQRRNQELLQAITDPQVADFYKANVRDEDYAAFKLRYYLTRDQADAVNVKGLLDKADKGAQAKLAPLGNAADGYLPFQGLPYGLGQVVRNAKVGDVIGPVMVRDGLLVLSLDEVRKGSKPELDKVKTEIRTLLADRQLSEELLALRKKAQIQLN